MKCLDRVYRTAARIKGFLSDEEGQALYDAAEQAADKGPCLEIGSYCGKSTVFLGTACRRKHSVLFCIDHHMGSEEQQPGEAYFDAALFDYRTFQVNTFSAFRQTVLQADLMQTVVPIVCASSTAARFWSTPLSLVFIDGGHALDTVRADFRLWARHLMPGGYLLFHDIYLDPQAGGQAPYRVYRHARSSIAFVEETIVDTLGVLRRTSVPSDAISAAAIGDG